ncbi:sensor domain-containing protein [Halorarum salinum]|uniref:Sensor domain-containing protein n=1 Tax=Halorarum salinum TaxID=2743089 RepID=A0A7D5L838_9EURY|nr:sensor domain-containing protein [Halobaculum salinum]QLG60486.1 sensor domain-containing protein [Halobaculum salinum]
MQADDHRRVPAVLPAPTLRSIIGVPLRLQTYRNLLYLLLAFPLGLLYFTFLAVGLSVGIGLAVTVVGVPVLLAVLATAVGLGSVERELTALLLGIDIDPPADSPLSLADDRPFLVRVKELVVGPATWKALTYLATKLVFGIASFVLITSLLVTGVALLFVPFVYDLPGVYVGVLFDRPTTVQSALAYGWSDLLVGVRGVVELTSWQVTTLPEATAVALLGVVVIVLSLNVLNGLAWLSGRYARVMLGGPAAA